MWNKIIFLTFLGIIIYSYVGYTFLLLIAICIKKLFANNKSDFTTSGFQPEVSILITSYNEKELLDKKIRNTLELNYPKNKLHILLITDGSYDGSQNIIKKYNAIQVLHEPERKGKTHAMNRGVKFVKTPVIVFSDANTILAKDAINEIVKYFEDKKVGCVAGEKRIIVDNKEKASGVGENIYWQYESFIKNLESDLHSTLAAAGELFAIRTDLYSEIQSDSILDDFSQSLQVALQGYKIKYAKKAYAIENASLNIKEELKRKTRIAAGSMQALIRYSRILNIFKYGFLSFQFLSHKILRWLIVPVSILILLVFNVLICLKSNFSLDIYTIFLALQVVFYLFILFGYFLRNSKISFKLIFIPYYIFIMNFSQIKGFFNFLTGRQTVLWEKVKRE